MILVITTTVANGDHSKHSILYAMDEALLRTRKPVFSISYQFIGLLDSRKN